MSRSDKINLLDFSNPGKLQISYRQAVASYEKEVIVPVVHLSYIFHESFELTWPGSELGA